VKPGDVNQPERDLYYVGLTVKEENRGMVAAGFSLDNVLEPSRDLCASTNTSAPTQRSTQNLAKLAISDQLLDNLDHRSRLALRAKHSLDALLICSTDQFSDLIHVGCQRQLGVHILASFDNGLQELVVALDTNDTDN